MGKLRNLQAALELAGDKHNYQIALIIVLCLLFFEVNFILIGPSYIFMNPTFSCGSSSGKIIKEDQACKQISQCEINQHFTLTAQMNLYCQKQWQRVIYQTMFSIGSLVGLLCMNIVSDTRGRRMSTLLSLFLSILGTLLNVLGGHSHSEFLLIISQLLLGFGGYSLFVLSYVLLTDFCEDSLRQKGIVLINASWGISLMVLGIFYLYKVSWLDFLSNYMFVPLCALFLLFALFLQETPYILMLHNKKQQCLDMLTRISKYNNRQQNLKQIKMLIFRKDSVPVKDSRYYLTKIWQIVKKWKNLKTILLVGFVYAVGNVMYFGIQFTFEDQGYNYGINSIIIGGVEMVSFSFLNFFIERISRTKGISFFYALTAVVGLLFALPVIEQNKVLAAMMIGVSRIFFTVGYTLIVCLQTESFSVQIQSTAAGIIQSLSLFGVIVAPGIVSLSISLGFNPMVVLSLLLILGIFPNKFIKETNKQVGSSIILFKKHKSSMSQQLISADTITLD